MSERPRPSQICWCGCGSKTARGSFFLPGHDRAAEAAVIKVVYGGIPQFLLEHGYSPAAKNPRKALAEWQRARKKTRRR